MHKHITRRIIFDTPVNKDIFQGQGHERVATLLVDTIVAHESTNISIGIEGHWGIGKSSVLKIAEKKLNQKGFSKDYYIFTFDIWKSQGSEFRRAILVSFINWAILTFPEKSTKLDKIRRKIYFTSREIETTKNPILTWYAIIILLSIPLVPLLPILYTSLSYIIEPKHILNLYLLALIPLYLIIVLVLLPYIYFKRDQNKGKQGEKSYTSYQERVSKILLSPQQILDHKIIHQERETNYTDFEFHSTLNEILDVIQNGNAKIIFVLDNIDRLPGEEITHYWSLVRSVVSREEHYNYQPNNTTLVTIVPYDYKSAFMDLKHPIGNTSDILTNDHNFDKEPLTFLPSRELILKTFDEIITVSPPVLSDAKLFFKQKLFYALSCEIPEDQVFRCYVIFCHLLNFHGRKTTPRQVISFVNELTRLYVLHRAEFEIPTIAAFLAHRELLTENPTMLNKKNTLDQEIIELTGDSEVIRNLAAITFNVDKDVASQILLDTNIATAAISRDSRHLMTLSHANGFELRVDDVVQNNINLWIKTNSLGRVIDNFSKCLPALERKFAISCPKLLTSAMDHVEQISLSDNNLLMDAHYKLYFSIFRFSDAGRNSVLLEKIIELAMNWIVSFHTSKNGEEFFDFLAYCLKELESYNLIDEFNLILKQRTLVTTTDFLFGFAGKVGGISVKFLGFQSVRLVDYKLGDLQKGAMESLSVAPQALVQLQKLGIVRAEEWINIANWCLGRLDKESLGRDDICNLLHLVCLSLLLQKDDVLNKLEIHKAFYSGQLFRNLESCESKQSTDAYAFTALIVREAKIDIKSFEEGIYVNNTPVSISRDGYVKFIELYNNIKYLNELRASLIAEI